MGRLPLDGTYRNRVYRVNCPRKPELLFSASEFARVLKKVAVYVIDGRTDSPGRASRRPVATHSQPPTGVLLRPELPVLVPGRRADRAGAGRCRLGANRGHGAATRDR